MRNAKTKENSQRRLNNNIVIKSLLINDLINDLIKSLSHY